MDDTIEQLSCRVETLKSKLANQKPKSLVEQLNDLNLRLNKLYDSNPDYKKLEKLISDLRIKSKCQQVINSYLKKEYNKIENDKVENDDKDKNKEESFAQQLKEEELLLYYGDIIAQYPAMVELEQMGYQSLIDKINTFISNRNFKPNIINVPDILRARENAITDIQTWHTMLLLKSMTIYEKYVDLIINSNRFWTETENKLTEYSRTLRKLQREREQNDRY